MTLHRSLYKGEHVMKYISKKNGVCSACGRTGLVFTLTISGPVNRLLGSILNKLTGSIDRRFHWICLSCQAEGEEILREIKQEKERRLSLQYQSRDTPTAKPPVLKPSQLPYRGPKCVICGKPTGGAAYCSVHRNLMNIYPLGKHHGH